MGEEVRPRDYHLLPELEAPDHFRAIRARLATYL